MEEQQSEWRSEVNEKVGRKVQEGRDSLEMWKKGRR